MSDAKAAPPERHARVARDALGYGALFLKNHGMKMLALFVCLLLPIWGFAALVDQLRDRHAFFFDAPILNALHAMQTPGLDRFFVQVSMVGFLWGTIPLDIAIFLWFAFHRRLRDGLFFGLAVVGSAVLDYAGKIYFARDRPDLWLSITPEKSFSFPSGHAMGSATLCMALVLLAWQTRWRWPSLVVAILFTFLVGASRVYLGVHYPSDILAGWSAAIAWVYGMYVLVDRKAPPQPSTADPSKDTAGKPA